MLALRTLINFIIVVIKAYMTIRFFILQAHYRSTVDFGNEALQAAEKGLARLMEGYKNLKRMQDGQKVACSPLSG